MDHAYSVLTVKSISEDERIIEGIASTPAPDTYGDILESRGVKYTLPIPLLWQHNREMPVGQVTFAEVADGGIKFRATIAKIAEPGALKDMVDKAWQAVKAKLVRGVSVGFQARRSDTERIGAGGGMRVKSWLWRELSLCVLPVNMDATIQNIRSCDADALALSGNERAESNRPPSRHHTKGKTPMNVKENMTALETKRAAVAAGMEAIMTKATGRVMDDAEKESFDDLADELGSLDDDLRRLRAFEKATAGASRVDGRTEGDGTRSRAGGNIILPQIKEDYPGQILVRAAMAVGAGKGSLSDTIAHAESHWGKSQPQVMQFLKANAGTIEPIDSSPPTSWGGQLVYAQNLVSEFVELLRAATVLGKLQGVRRIPFNVRIPVQTGGSTVNWVAELGSKPVGELAFDFLTHTVSKIAGIVVASEELVRLSSPAAEQTIRMDLTNAIVQFMDEQLLNPAITETPARPASITHNVTPVPASGTDANALFNDMNAALATFDEAETGTANLYVITRPSVARGIGSLRNALGQFEVPTVSPTGGTFMGYPLIISNSSPAGDIILVKADEIFLSDDGGVRLDASNQATLDMDGGSPPTPTFNLWQRNCVGIRAERFVRWSKRRAASVALITGAAYAPPSTSP